MHRPEPVEVWTIGVDFVEWRGADAGGFGRVLARIPPRLIDPREPFDYRASIDEIMRAHEEILDIETDWGGDDLIEEDMEDEDDEPTSL